MGSSWETLAKNNAAVQAWWKQMQGYDPRYASMDMIDFMKTDPSNYNYQQSIENGMFPSFQPEHGQYRWSDLGKGQNFNAPNSTEIPLKKGNMRQNLVKTLLGL